MNRASFCWLWKKTLDITTNLTNPETASVLHGLYSEKMQWAESIQERNKSNNKYTVKYLNNHGNYNLFNN